MAQALWFTAPGRVELRDEPLPEPQADEVLARGLFSAVSHGTEGLLVTGYAPECFDPSLAPNLATPYPRRYGYAWVGEIVGGCLPAGTRVFSLATHADGHVLKREAVRIVPKEIPAARATLAASLETALNAVWDAELCLGSEVLVLGGGTVGVLVAHLAEQAGARVVLVDPNMERRQRAEALGLRGVCSAVPDATVFDVVFEVTGNPTLLNSAIAACRSEGRVVVVSFYGKKAASVALGERFHRERLQLVSSQVSVLPPALRGRFDHARRFETVLQLLRDGRLDALVQVRTAFRDAEATYRRLALGQVADQIVFDYASGASSDVQLEHLSG